MISDDDEMIFVGCCHGHATQGLGVAEYANKDRVIGNFVGTHLDGYGVFTFGSSGKAR